jgi:hypothetical protein
VAEREEDASKLIDLYQESFPHYLIINLILSYSVNF